MRTEITRIIRCRKTNSNKTIIISERVNNEIKRLRYSAKVIKKHYGKTDQYKHLIKEALRIRAHLYGGKL